MRKGSKHTPETIRKMRKVQALNRRNLGPDVIERIREKTRAFARLPGQHAKRSRWGKKAAEKIWSEKEGQHNPLLMRRVKLSAQGLAASGLTDRGFGPDTRGTCQRSRFPSSDKFIAVLVDGAGSVEHWGRVFWEAAE